MGAKTMIVCVPPMAPGTQHASSISPIAALSTHWQGVRSSILGSQELDPLRRRHALRRARAAKRRACTRAGSGWVDQRGLATVLELLEHKPFYLRTKLIEELCSPGETYIESRVDELRFSGPLPNLTT